VEVDIWRIGLLASYTNFLSLVTDIQVHQFNIMAGFALFSTDALTWRLMAGLDMMIRNSSMSFGPVVGTNLRTLWARFFGIDTALMATLFPYRQIEFRASFVLRLWILELHLGWRLQVIDATLSGNLVTLFTSSPGITGPVASVGLTF
jgi:hypothetical protein